MSNKVALVTGGARGIGAGIVRSFLNNDYRVMICDIGLKAEYSDWAYKLAELSDIESLRHEFEHCEACFVDVTDNESCLDAVKTTIDVFGQLDVLINNAGVVNSGPIESFSEQNWDRIFDVNSKGIFLMSKAALPELKKSDNASIINTASIAGKSGYANMSAYCGSKFAAIGITQSLASELAPEGIRVNAICPGMVGTAMWLDHLLPSNAVEHSHKKEEFEKMMQERIPLGRAQTTQDMGEAALYLATAKNVTGISLSVSGGFEMN
jgi:meso-butanediol dehydrogenase/(S,S)-butanediol dehydrogenase/diacetyl reductase